MNLETYLRKHRLSQREFAELVGCTQPRICQLLAGDRPSFSLAVKIALATGGDVRFDDWLPARERKKARGA